MLSTTDGTPTAASDASASAPSYAPPAPVSGNTLGRLLCLTLFTPIRPQWSAFLSTGFSLGKHASLSHEHVLQFNFIHFVRWTVVNAFPYNGAPQQRENLRYSYLFFESNFDGPWQHYIDAFAYCIPFDINFVWGRGFAFPGPPPSEPLKRWIAKNSMEGGSYYCAYPHASTRMVKSAVAVKDALEAFAADAQMLDPATFKTKYEDFLTSIQEHLS
jgi:hypothetical protein